jgi:hypothetical protein
MIVFDDNLSQIAPRIQGSMLGADMAHHRVVMQAGSFIAESASSAGFCRPKKPHLPGNSLAPAGHAQ